MLETKKYGCLVCYISYLVFQCVIEEMECCVVLKVGTDEMQYVMAVEGLDVCVCVFVLNRYSSKIHMAQCKGHLFTHTYTL